MSKQRYVFKPGKGSWLTNRYFKRLIRMVKDEILKEIDWQDDPRWEHVMEAVITSVTRWAKNYHCTAMENKEGGHVCLYSSNRPVFALRIASYARHRVEELHKGKAYYRGLLDIVTPVPPEGANLDSAEIIKRMNEPPMVLYLPLANIHDGKWRQKMDFDLIDVIEMVKAHPGYSGTQYQHRLNMSPNKLWGLLDLLRRQRILNHRGDSIASRWYLNHEIRSDSGSKSDSASSDSGSDSSSDSSSDSDWEPR